MTLLPDWKEILKTAWSVRFIVLAAVLSGLEAVLPLFTDSFPRGTFAAFSGVLTAAALLARVLAQPVKADDAKKE